MPEPIIPSLESVVIDCRSPERLAHFWGELLGVGISQQYPGFIWLSPQRSGSLSLAFQQVPDPTPGKNRVHLDAAFSDLDAARARVEELGGSMVDSHEIAGFHWHVFADPEGNIFDIGQA